MNPDRVELIYRKSRFYHGPSSYECLARTDTRGGNRIKAELAICWAISLSVKLYDSGCHKWAESFLLWAWDCYHPFWWGLPADSEENKRVEIRILTRAAYISQELYNKYKSGCIALTDDEHALFLDAWNRGIEPADALWPRPRRNKKLIRLMAAAKTIAHHET